MKQRKNKQIHQRNLGSAKSSGRSYGQKMITGHKGADHSTRASAKDDSRQMRKCGISL